MEPNELPDFLASIRRANTYKVPPQYFDTLADDILGKVHVPAVSAMPFSEPPTGYFDGLADNILQKIKRTEKSDVLLELEEVEPFLAGISKTNMYTVPQGYFETFQVPLTVKKESAPVIKMNSRAKWITYAAAAVVTGVIAISVILFAGNNDASPASAKYTAALAKVSDTHLADYLDNSATDIDVTPVSNTGTINSNDLYQQLIHNVSDNDIQQYLNENNNSNEKNSKGI